ncbi:MAG: hypothetical protein QM793_08150 [Muricomes sp.]
MTQQICLLSGITQENITPGISLEALSIGVDMKPTDVAFRCNLVTLTEEQDVYEDREVLFGFIVFPY